MHSPLRGKVPLMRGEVDNGGAGVVDESPSFPDGQVVNSSVVAPSSDSRLLSESQRGLQITAGLRLTDLPPLPARRVQTRNQESCCGIWTVLVLIVILDGAGIGGVANMLEGKARIVMMLVMAGWTTIALLCLLYLLLGNAGEVRRSRRTCFPVPPEVQEKLKKGESLDGMANISEPGSGKTYCVRCLVWRPGRSQKPHHCSICQRCVTGFDHHCGVFGRCIAKGNMWAFCLIIFTAVAAILSVMAGFFFAVMKSG
eukprot:Hpha_TRINITY_DN13216_c0_g1::TRINITY_DN13216_c0_g1_i1::g.154790::m.154790